MRAIGTAVAVVAIYALAFGVTIGLVVLLMWALT